MKYNPKIVAAYFKEMELPEPSFEYRFHANRKWRWDIAWPDTLLAIEVEGGIFIRGGHNRGAQMLKDWEKRNTATACGWRYLLFQPKDLCMSETIDYIKSAMSHC